MKDAAEHLYELFTSSDVADVPLLLMLNKLNVPEPEYAGKSEREETTRTQKQIVEELEREIERMRVSKSTSMEGQDATGMYIGVEGIKFQLDHAPCDVEVCTASVKLNELGGLFDFLRGAMAKM